MVKTLRALKRRISVTMRKHELTREQSYFRDYQWGFVNLNLTVPQYKIRAYDRATENAHVRVHIFYAPDKVNDILEDLRKKGVKPTEIRYLGGESETYVFEAYLKDLEP